MPVNPETQNLTGRKPKVRRKKSTSPSTPATSSINAIEGGKGVRQSHQQAVSEHPTGAGRAPITAERKQAKKRRVRKRARQQKAALRVLKAQERAFKGDNLKDTYHPSSAAEKELRQAQKKAAKNNEYEGGLVDLVAPGLAKDVRKTVFGTNSPSVGEVALTLAPIPAYKAVKAGQTILRGERALKTAKRAEEAAAAAEKAKAARKAERAAARAKEGSRAAKARVTAKGMSKQARKRLEKTEAKAAAKRTAHRSADRAVRSATSPVAAAASAAPGDVGDRTRAFIKGTATANPIKSTETTLEAVPGLFTGGMSVAGAGYRSLKSGDPKYITGALKALGEGTVDVVKPYVSGDEEQVRKATEEGAGYILAPLLPRGAISRPARFVRGKVRSGAERAAEPVAKRVRVRRARSGRMAPGKLQHGIQIVTGGKKRKGVAVEIARATAPELRHGQERATNLERAANKSKGHHTLRNLTGPDAGAAAGILARYGITRKNTLARLDDVVRKTDNPGNDLVNLTNTAKWLREHPEVIKDDRFWDLVAEVHKATKPLETSKRAKYGAQGDVAGVTRPEHAVPFQARDLTEATTREAAIKDMKGRKRAADAAKHVARKQPSAANRQAAQQAQAHYEVLRDALKGYTAKNTWDKRLVDEYENKVRAERHPDLEDSAWLAEKPLKQDPAVPGGGTQPLAVHVNTGAARKADSIDRSLAAIQRDSIIGPHVARGTARGIRAVLDKFKREVDGRSVFTGKEIIRLAQEGKVDLTTVKAVPSRWWKQATASEVFDAAKFHTETADLLNRELADLQNTKGTKYVLLDNEHAAELVDQLKPEPGRMEKVVGTTAGIGSRIVLYSPAWVAAQVVNETSQVIADVGLRGATGGAADLVKMYLKDPEGYRATLRAVGDPSPSAHPVSPRVQAAAGDYVDITAMGRVARRTPLGRFLYDAVRLRTFSNIDRWKSTRIRAIAKLAHENREFGKFTRGVSGTLRQMDEVSAKLAKMSRTERHNWIRDHPAVEHKILDHVDDMLGNWEAFTRLERSFGPLAAFYPYLRMSLRWTFQTFPKAHPIRAQIFYLLAQQNRDQLTKLLGSEPSFIQGAYPALYNTKGEPDAAMPGGARFGAPGSNVLVEAIGSENVAGLARALNPTISTGAFGFFGINPFTGKQEAAPGTTEWGLGALESLLSMSPVARATGVSKLQEQSDAAKVFSNLDPNRAMRSFLNPFLPQSAERLRMQQTLSNALEAAQDKPEYGDLVDAIVAKDRKKVRELAKRVDLAKDAQKVLDEFLPAQPGEDKALSKASSISYDGTKALRKARRKPSSSSTASSSDTPAWLGGGSTSAQGGNSKSTTPGWLK